MYATFRDRPILTERSDEHDQRHVGVGANVVFLGLTSMLTDVSSEMVNAILPLYLTFQLRFSPLQFGLFDGAYQGMTALVRIWGGLVADRRRRYKEVAGAGYAMSAMCKIGLLASTNAWLPTTGFLFADRLGKGVRSAPRDALISLSSSPARLGEAFGVHRAMDTFGALLGPVAAFALLGFVPHAYDAVFMTSFCFALLGLGVLMFFVRNERVGVPRPGGLRSRPTLRTAVGLLRLSPFRAVVIAGGLLSLVTIGDAFIYLNVQRRAHLSLGAFPLLYVGTALAYLVLAVPAGRIADRVGRRTVFLLGHVFLLGAYLALRLPNPGGVALVVLLGLLGAYYAATDGVLMALASAIVPADARTSGLAVLTTVTAVARFAAAVLFGFAWATRGAGWAIPAFMAGLVIALPVAGALLRQGEKART